MFKLPDGSLRLIVQGLARVTLDTPMPPRITITDAGSKPSSDLSVASTLVPFESLIQRTQTTLLA